jgi:hypothetical protein
MKQPSFKAMLNAGTMSAVFALATQPATDRYQERVVSKPASAFRRSDKRATRIGNKGRRRLRLHPFMTAVYIANHEKLAAKRIYGSDNAAYALAEQKARMALAKEMKNG